MSLVFRHQLTWAAELPQLRTGLDLASGQDALFLPLGHLYIYIPLCVSCPLHPLPCLFCSNVSIRGVVRMMEPCDRLLAASNQLGSRIRTIIINTLSRLSMTFLSAGCDAAYPRMSGLNLI